MRIPSMHNIIIIILHNNDGCLMSASSIMDVLDPSCVGSLMRSYMGATKVFHETVSCVYTCTHNLPKII